VKGAETKKEGLAFKFGLADSVGSKLPSREVPVAELADGRFHIFELGPFKADSQLMLWMATGGDGSMSEVYLDCLWLRRLD